MIWLWLTHLSTHSLRHKRTQTVREECRKYVRHWYEKVWWNSSRSRHLKRSVSFRKGKRRGKEEDICEWTVAQSVVPFCQWASTYVASPEHVRLWSDELDGHAHGRYDQHSPLHKETIWRRGWQSGVQQLAGRLLGVYFSETFQS